ncbi:MAG: glycosyltransferase [Bacteroidota bacterium]|nr:glycosyltransferase [Bacteroidota bacterium]
MKILMLGAGSSVHVVRWANAFVERGHELHLASQHGKAPGLDPKVSMHDLPHLNGSGYLLNGNKVKEIVRKVAPDVVNAHYASGYGTLSNAIRNVPVVLNVWGSDVFEFPDKSFFHRRLLLRNLRNATLLVSTSKFMRERTTSLLGTDQRRIEVIPFGVDTDRFKPTHKERSDNTLTIGTVKGLARKYGIDLLLKAFAIIIQQKPDADLKLKIAGGGPLERELKRYAEQLGIIDKVEFTGPVPHAQVPGILNSFDIYVALSRADSESFGVAVIEASACGIPVVVANVGGLPEVVRNGITGTIVPKEDPQAAAKAIKELMRSEVLRQKQGNAGREFVMKEFSWSDCVDKMIAVLESSMTSKR